MIDRWVCLSSFKKKCISFCNFISQIQISFFVHSLIPFVWTLFDHSFIIIGIIKRLFLRKRQMNKSSCYENHVKIITSWNHETSFIKGTSWRKQKCCFRLSCISIRYYSFRNVRASINGFVMVHQINISIFVDSLLPHLLLLQLHLQALWLLRWLQVCPSLHAVQ